MSHSDPNPVPKRPLIGLYGGNILFAAPRRWDEACFSVPALRAIRNSKPTCTLGVICHEDQLEFWRGIIGIDDIISYNDRSTLRSIVRQQSQSRYTWESAILWEFNKGSEYCHAMKIKQRLGYAGKELKKFLTDTIAAPVLTGPVEHRVQHYLRLIASLNMPTQKPELFGPVKMEVQQLPGTVLVSPESDYGASHEWQLERWLQTIKLLESIGAKVVVAGLDRSRSGLAGKVAAQFSEKCEHVMLETLSSALPIIAAHSLVIAADSSLCHLAAHVGVTTIALFGPNEPAWRRPLGKQHMIVRQKVECSPCLSAKCLLDFRCQKELKYEEVAKAIMLKYVCP
jgi:ADP-heptose:LPS heptosyltransferase